MNEQERRRESGYRTSGFGEFIFPSNGVESGSELHSQSASCAFSESNHRKLNSITSDDGAGDLPRVYFLQNEKENSRPSVSGISFKLMMLIIILILFGVKEAIAQQPSPNPGNVPLPSISLGVDTVKDPEDFTITLQIILLMTILTLAPAILIMLTSFTRIVIVFHFIRQALGTQQIPPNQVLIGLALFLTFFVMGPTWENVHDQALRPYLNGQISQKDAYKQASKPIRQFLFQHTREKDLALFVKLFSEDKPYDQEDVSNLMLIPAFVISELRVAFQIGFILYIPFLIIDMVVASVLMSMGMMMLPPMMVSLPFKLLLFVLVDGWYLLVSSLIGSF